VEDVVCTTVDDKVVVDNMVEDVKDGPTVAAIVIAPA
jgi:hypothetical protein